MLKLFICLSFAVLSVYGTGELTVLHSPESCKFVGHDEVSQSLMKDIFSASMGFTITKGSDWAGLSIAHPFSYAEAVVAVMVDGLSSLDLKKGQSYPMITDEDESVCWQALRDRVLQRYPEENSTLYRMDLIEEIPHHPLLGDYDDVPKNWSVKYLDTSKSEDKQFLKEMSIIFNLVKSGLVQQDGVPDVYWIVVRGLHPLVDIYGLKSPAVEEATQILVQQIDRLTKAVVQAYKKKVLVATLCSDVSHTRRTRSLKATTQEVDQNLNLAPEYSADYPVIFNIMLWFGIAFVFSLLAVSLFIADMDPGRDSIIYRMTSTRMKKDN